MPLLITQAQAFERDLALEMRESESDDYDFIITSSALQEPKPFQTPKLNSRFNRKSRGSALLPAPPTRTQGPLGVFAHPYSPKGVGQLIPNPPSMADQQAYAQWWPFWQWAIGALTSSAATSAPGGNSSHPVESYATPLVSGPINSNFAPIHHDGALH